jgi:hypothetical protein
VSHPRRTRRSREKVQGDMAIIHRTVWWCTGLSGESTVGRAIFARHVVAPTVGWAHRTVRCAPDSVRCANRSRGPTVGCSPYGKKSSIGHKQWLSDGAQDCPVHHSTEGRNCLPRLCPTAPSCLGAIKGTPKRMEEKTKHSLSILKHPDSALAHSLHCVSNLSSI